MRKLPCDRCGRPARVRALYYRANGSAVLSGRYGGACFYVMAGLLAESGVQPEHENAKPVWLRRGTR